MSYVISGTITGQGSMVPPVVGLLSVSGKFVTVAGKLVQIDNELTVEPGDTVTFDFTADSDWEISDILIDGVSIGPADSHTFENIYSNYHIEAVFTVADPVTFLVRTENNVGGLISPYGDILVEAGTDIEFTFTVNDGYEQTAWVLDGVDQPLTPTFTIPSVSQDHIIGVKIQRLIEYRPSVRTMQTEEVTVVRRDFQRGSYDDTGYRVVGPDYQTFKVLASKQPGQTQSGMLQAVGEQVRQGGDYDNLNKSWKVFTYDELRVKDLLYFEGETEGYEVLDVDDWTVSTRFKSINYRSMARRVEDRGEGG